MHVVINIPIKLYALLKYCEKGMGLTDKNTQDSDDVKTALMRAVIHGTPLPKGHKRLIEVTDQLEQELYTFQRYTGIAEVPFESATIITDDAPTIIPADKTGNGDKE